MLQLDVESATVGYGYHDAHNSIGMVAHGPQDITCIAHDNTGMHMAVGTGGGLVGMLLLLRQLLELLRAQW